MFVDLETSFLNKLKEVEKKYSELTQKLSDPKILSNATEQIRIAKERAEHDETIEFYETYKTLKGEIADADEMRQDEDADLDFKALAEAEWQELTEKQEKIIVALKSLLRPKSPYENRNLFLEIRAGTGGDEAALFVGDLMRMYTKYAELQAWKAEIINTSETGIGGFKEVILSVIGKGAYRHLQYESGVHRVQRVRIYEGTDEILKLKIAAALLGKQYEAFR